jgi:hypothetical protein
MHDELESEITAGAVRALRSKARSRREHAARGITFTECRCRPLTIVASESRAALNVADDWDSIADDLEGVAT